MKKSYLLTALLLLSLCTVFAADTVPLKVHALFSDNMVLQRDVPVPVWGKAAPGAKITVKIAGQSKETAAAKDGSWLVRLDPMPAGVKLTMTVSDGRESRTFSNMACGDVWLCTGQSNMALSVRRCSNYKLERRQANHPDIRYFSVPHRSVAKPEKDLPATSWVICSPKTVLPFSGAAYFFARDLQKELKVPIGIVNSSVGGTPGEAWTAAEVLESDPDLKPIMTRFNHALSVYPEAKKRYDTEEARRKNLSRAEIRKLPRNRAPMGIGHPQAPTGLYNAMISPLMPLAFKGAVWYQGETNVYRAMQYRKLLPAMIRDWRTKWGRGDFPFLIVQLAGYMKPQTTPGPDRWAELREAQAMALSLPNTALAVAADIGEENNIHPRNKQEVGRRLMLAALHLAYGRKLVYSGPVYQSMKKEGPKIRLSFSQTGSGLAVRGGGALQRFSIAGADRKFVWADALLEGNTVVVYSDKVPSPAAVRYAWESNPAAANLINQEGLPAVPFRTDDWPMITRHRR